MYPLTIVVGNASEVIQQAKKEIKFLNIIICDSKMDTVKQITDTIDNLSIPVLFYFPEAGKMYKSVKSSLLKLTEESPRNVFFVLACKNENVFPATLKSRANIVYIGQEILVSPQAEELAWKIIEAKLNPSFSPKDVMCLSNRIKFYKKDEENPDKIDLYVLLHSIREQLVIKLKENKNNLSAQQMFGTVGEAMKLCRLSNCNKLCIFDKLALE